MGSPRFARNTYAVIRGISTCSRERDPFSRGSRKPEPEQQIGHIVKQTKPFKKEFGRYEATGTNPKPLDITGKEIKEKKPEEKKWYSLLVMPVKLVKEAIVAAGIIVGFGLLVVGTALIGGAASILEKK